MAATAGHQYAAGRRGPTRHSDTHAAQVPQAGQGGGELEDDDYVEIGTVVGFDPKRIERMWNALAKLALHVRLPEHKDDHIPDYGDKTKVHAKVTEVVAELERLAKGSMTFSGVPIGGDVTFECTCGENNRRRAALLKDGQHVYCMNPECKEMWQVVKQEDGGTGFEADRVTIDCEQCKAPNHMPRRFFLELKTDQIANFLCRACDHKNYVQWRLMQVTPKNREDPGPSESGPTH